MKRQPGRHRRAWHVPKKVRIGSLIVLAVFVVTNGVVWAVYRQRTYPRTSIGSVRIGSVAYGQLAKKTDQLQLLPKQVTFVHPLQKAQQKSPVDNGGGLDEGYDARLAQRVTVSTAALGVRTDTRRTVDNANAQRSWLPVLNLFRAPKLLMPVGLDSKAFKAQSAELAKQFHKDAVNARLNLAGTTVSIVESINGFSLVEASLQKTLLSSLDQGRTNVLVPVQTLHPKVTAKAMKDKQTDLEQQLKVAVTYTYQGKSKQAPSTDIAAWYVSSGDVYAASPDRIQTYILATSKSLNMRVKNISQAVTATQQALSKHQPLQMELVHQPALKTFSYCAAVRGVDSAYLNELRPRLQSTYGDPRGWSLDGLVELKEVTGGCDFTVWLTAASLMPTFGAICDSTWSCRVGPNVVINFDRWQNASPSWNASGGVLEEYRHMVINHETGHWFGFNHSFCGGPGQLAPVMQQQSIDLQDCKFNAWPTPSELTSLHHMLGI